MVHYTSVESPDYGLLVFKVIGAASREEAQNLTQKNLCDTLYQGLTLEGPPIICPLFQDLNRLHPG